jgi:transcriptional regulator with GAF, ATPase, and Fis domain
VPTRIIEAARTLIKALRKPLPASEDPPYDWRGFSFRSAVRRYERALIQRALQDSNGVVSRAAQLLGFRHYQSLISLINKRHRDLREARSPVVSRRKGIIKK